MKAKLHIGGSFGLGAHADVEFEIPGQKIVEKGKQIAKGVVKVLKNPIKFFKGFGK